MSGKPRSGLTSLVVAGQATLGLLVALATGAHVMEMRARALADAERGLSGLALVLADQAERAFEAVDLVQATFMEMVRTRGFATPGDLRRGMGTEEMNREINAHGSALPQLDVIGLVGADGNFVNLSHNWPPPPNNVADRLYFMALEGDPERQAFVSDVIRNRLTDAPAVTAASAPPEPGVASATPTGRFERPKY